MLIGKGMYIWQLAKVEGANPKAITEQAQAAGLTHVLIKIADGSVKYNMRRDTPTTWKDDILEPVVKSLQAAGIQVWGWQYIYLIEPAKEAALARTRVTQFGLDGFVMDVEAECKNQPEKTGKYLAGLATLSVPVGLSSYRYPRLHNEISWGAWLNRADVVMPQVYWMGATNSGEQLAISYQEYTRLMGKSPKPYIPTGSAFSEHKWTAQIGEVIEFLDQAQALGLPGVNFWSWQHVKGLPGMWDAIAGYKWGEPAPEPGPVPVDQWVVDYLYPWAQSQGYKGPEPTYKE